MASGSSMMNGDISHPRGSGPGNVGSLEETLQQMNTLIKENRELKEALKQTNLSMKERFEGLSAWKETQKEERDFLEKRLEEAKTKLNTMDAENEMLKKRVEELEKSGVECLDTELEALRAQIGRLQAEKNDLVALNSELQLKTGQGSPRDSFIEIRIAEDDDLKVTRDLPSTQKDLSAFSMQKGESEEQTVRQLLHSLRVETDEKERLQITLQEARARIAELENRLEHTDSSAQTSLPCTTEINSSAEVKNLEEQLLKLCNELKQAQIKLDDAENMKRNLQDRCKDLEQDLATVRAQLGEKQKTQAENDCLKVQMESLQAAIKLEQKKTQDEKNNLNQLKDAYTKLFEDYNELQEEKKKKEGSVSREEYDDLQTRFATAEKALADKQLKIDEMKMEIFKKEKELETISVFQAQAEIYSSDFYAERAAREKIHEEKERLATQLEYVKKQNSQLQEEMESLGRHSMSEMQRRHVPRGANPQGPTSPHNLQGGDWQQHDIPDHACPKCGEVLPDLDSLQIHIMDCII
ncbi:optineurin [Pimephales promelas]|uniref:optineurin n=1 Tax=Pimephales promelas TaxID=90988 RepID=UPI001955DD10|nr:optineurin [Pimephales promelas]KAG1952609.1 NF-kappa-B essential modulator [Pimephales promelas]KAG1952610.1 NF-kappa-B essential modulator [Pimephales promelas]